MAERIASLWGVLIALSMLLTCAGGVFNVYWLETIAGITLLTLFLVGFLVIMAFFAWLAWTNRLP